MTWGPAGRFIPLCLWRRWIDLRENSRNLTYFSLSSIFSFVKCAEHIHTIHLCLYNTKSCSFCLLLKWWQWWPRNDKCIDGWRRCCRRFRNDRRKSMWSKEWKYLLLTDLDHLCIIVIDFEFLHLNNFGNNDYIYIRIHFTQLFTLFLWMNLFVGRQTFDVFPEGAQYEHAQTHNF